jgi:uncharacterized protein
MTTTKELSPITRLRSAVAAAPPFQSVDSSISEFTRGHAQTLLGHFLPSPNTRWPNTRRTNGKATAAERVELRTPDGDRLVGFMSKPVGRDAVGLLHIFHGLAGSSESHYMPRAGRAALELGFSVVLWNHRGCGPGRKLALEPYHSGRSDDMARVVRWGRENVGEQRNSKRGAEKPFVHGLLGYSLSANAACLLAARVVPALDTHPLSKKMIEKTLPGALPDFAIAINPPFDLRRASTRLSGGASRIYGQNFMPALIECLEDRAKWQPESEQRAIFRNLATRARKNLSVFNDVGTFDAAYTGPAGGFVDQFDYYDRASSGRYLDQTALPLVVLSADDDPITHGFADLAPDVRRRARTHENIVFDEQRFGGHMGYVDRATLFSPWRPQARWLESRIAMYLQAFQPLTTRQKEDQ